MSVLLARADARYLPLRDGSVQCCVTSVPYYGLRSYDTGSAKALEIGSEPSVQEWFDNLVAAFREVRRVLRDDGVLWLNCGDSYGHSRCGPQGSGGEMNDRSVSKQRSRERGTDLLGAKEKDLLMLPARLAMALQADGWFLRSQIPWLKRNCLPESVEDRPTTAVEYLFLLTKRAEYFYDAQAVKARSTERASGNVTRRLGEDRDRPGTQVGNSIPYQPDGSGRNRRNSDWFMESWQGLLGDDDGEPLAFMVNTVSYKGSHYATFPPRLVEPCILAGTSAKGACLKCGAPWERLVETPDFSQQPKRKTVAKAEGEMLSHGAGFLTSGGQAWQDWRDAHPNRTIDWRPTCSCEDAGEPRPCIVLDPFCGTATVARVAIAHGRRAVCFDLSATYLRDLATKRTRNVQLEMIR